MMHLSRPAERLLAALAPDSPVADLYGDRGSEVYDAMTRGDGSEVREVLRVARRRRGRILDLASGSGRLTLPLARLGRETVALDSSPRMLELLSARADAAGVDVIRTVTADMSDFDLEERFDLIVLATTSISLLDRPRRRMLLDAVRRHLEPGGVFLVSAHATPSRPAEDETRLIPLPGREPDVVVLSEHRDVSAGHRDVSVVRVRRLGGEFVVEAFSSRVQLLDAESLREELREAGLTVDEARDVRFGGDATAVTLLECSA